MTVVRHVTESTVDLFGTSFAGVVIYQVYHGHQIARVLLSNVYDHKGKSTQSPEFVTVFSSECTSSRSACYRQEGSTTDTGFKVDT
jgi:hypothetical protein